MKITIDTQHDTYEDIKKVLQILTTILDRKETTAEGNIDTTNLMSMFSDDSGKAALREAPSSPPDFGSFLSLTNNTPKEKKDWSKVEVY